MTKSSFIGSGERAYELLGLIDTNVCGPIRFKPNEDILILSSSLTICLDMDFCIL